MPMSKDFHLVPIESLRLPESRQRKALGDIGELRRSIELVGLINPVTIRRDGTIVAGARRYTALRELGEALVPAHYVDELDPSELHLIELEENIKRKALTWQEEALAVLEYHETQVRLHDGEWPQSQTAEASGLSQRYVERAISVARELRAGNERVAACDSLFAASNVISRATAREVASELSRLNVAKLFDENAPPEAAWEAEEPEEPTGLRDAALDIVEADFTKWAPAYQGRKFNFIHCDFPYGIGLDQSPQINPVRHGAYEDSPETYWRLCECLAANIDRIALPSCHIMFWFYMANYEATLAFFREAMPSFVCEPVPLVWLKSDGRGVLPDPLRGPRRIYETALMLSRDDRKIVEPVFNGYAAPTSRATSTHASQKPEPVLRHFFRLFVDHVSEVLDPTCGSGTALCAAEALGARRVFGLDISGEYVETAREALQRQRRLASLSSSVGG